MSVNFPRFFADLSKVDSTMEPFLILTHPGGAHKDDFLACAVLVHELGVPVVRREPEPADLDDASVWVVDVGHRHERECRNFDHHQFPPEHPPACALSLVLEHLGVYEDARLFFDWLETAEWLDARGPVETARWLEIDRETLGRLNSPVDGALLRWFAASERLEPGEPLWETMRRVGGDLVGYLAAIRERLDIIERHGEFWESDLGLVLFMPRTEPLPAEPSQGLGEFIRRKGLEEEVAGLIYPDRRGAGYGLTRFQDHPRLDFTRLAEEEDVHFTHARGFVAKTAATDRERLRTLFGLAVLPD